MNGGKVLAIGLSNSGFQNTTFFSNTNLYEYNVVLWDIPAFENELNGYAQHTNILKTVPERVERLNKWVCAGHSLILLGYKQIMLPYFGTDLRQLAPLGGILFEEAEGNKIETCGPASANDLLKIFLGHLSYNVIIGGHALSPLLRVVRGTPGAPQIVGGFQEFEKGQVIYLPNFVGRQVERQVFFTQIVDLPATLVRQQPSLPEWVNNYHTQTEEVARNLITKLNNEVAVLHEKIAEQQETVDASLELKQLIAGTGESFANIAGSALQELGLMVVDGPHPRADLLASNGRRFAAIEAKGVDGPAKEGHLRQVTVWMAEVDTTLSIPQNERDPDHIRYFEKLGMLKVTFEEPQEDCKGILVIGTFRSTPLSQRTEPDFPDAVQRRLAHLDVCVLTGVQLLGLVMEARANPAARDGIIKELFDTRGVLQRGRDWKQFLAVK